MRDVSLKPLGLGELLDRAISLCVRYFAPLAIIAFLWRLPLIVVATMSARSSAVLLEAVFRTAHGSAQKPVVHALGDPGLSALMGVVILVEALLGPVAYCAMMLCIASAYRREEPNWRFALGTAFSHLPALLGLALFAAVLIVGALMAAIFVGTIGAIITAAVYIAAHALGVIAGIIAAGLMLAAFIAVVLLIIITVLMMFAVVDEQLTFWQAVGTSFTRVLNRKEAARSLLFALCAILVVMASTVVGFALAAALLLGIHAPLVYGAVNSIVDTIATILLCAMASVYYLDLRVREGVEPQTAFAPIPNAANV